MRSPSLINQANSFEAMAKTPIPKSAASTITKHLGAGGKAIVQNLNPLEIAREYVSFLKTASEQKTERARISAKRAVALKAIEAEKTVILAYFQHRFAERREALDGLFAVLHGAVDKKDNHAMDVALSGIVGILQDSPLKDFESFRRARDNKEIIEI